MRIGFLLKGSAAQEQLEFSMEKGCLLYLSPTTWLVAEEGIWTCTFKEGLRALEGVALRVKMGAEAAMALLFAKGIQHEAKGDWEGEDLVEIALEADAEAFSLMQRDSFEGVFDPMRMMDLSGEEGLPLVMDLRPFEIKSVVQSQAVEFSAMD